MGGLGEGGSLGRDGVERAVAGDLFEGENGQLERVNWAG